MRILRGNDMDCSLFRISSDSMGVDGTMAKGTRYTPEFRAKAVRLLAESRSPYSSETKAIEQVRQGSGDRAGITAPLAQRGGRHRGGGDQAVGRGGDGGAQEAEGRGRGAASGERDPDDGVGFFRGEARPGTALKVAYIDEFKDRFGVGPVCRVLAEPLDCGFLTPRGCRMFRSGPVSRMAARHEASARGHHDDAIGFLHGRVRVQEDARAADRPGPGPHGGRPRPGGEHHARARHPGRAPRQNPGDDQARQGHGRQAGSGGQEVRGQGSEPPARGRHHLRAHGQRLVRLHGVRRRRVRPSDRGMGARHDHEHAGAAAAGVGAGHRLGRDAWRHRRARASQRPWPPASTGAAAGRWSTRSSKLPVRERPRRCRRARRSP